MIATAKALVGAAGPVLGFVALGVFALSRWLADAQGLDLVERYGVLGLLAMVVLGIGGGIVAVGRQLVRVGLDLTAEVRQMREAVRSNNEQVMSRLEDLRGFCQSRHK